MPLLAPNSDLRFQPPAATGRRIRLPDIRQRGFWTCAIFLAALFISAATEYGYDAIVLHLKSVYAENGPMENMQAALIALSCFVFLTAAYKITPGKKLVSLFFSWLSYTFFLREVDVAKLDVPYAIKMVAAGRGRDAILAVMLAMIAIIGFRQARHYRSCFVDYVRSLPGVLIVACGICLVVADFFEKAHGVPFHDFYEELIELAGYSLMFLGAAETLRSSVSPEPVLSVRA